MIEREKDEDSSASYKGRLLCEHNFITRYLRTHGSVILRMKDTEKADNMRSLLT